MLTLPVALNMSVDAGMNHIFTGLSIFYHSKLFVKTVELLYVNHDDLLSFEGGSVGCKLVNSHANLTDLE